MTTPAGYTYDADLPASPVSRQDLNELLASLMWSDEDATALRRAGELLTPRTSEILDVWYGFVGSTPHLVSVFAGKGGQPDAAYLEAVRGRFERWIVDLCTRDFDEHWLAYQQEIARRHTTKKNETDHVDSPSGHVPLRHLIALLVPVTVTIRPFLEKGDDDAATVDAMYTAWQKAVTLTVALWSQPYSPELW